MVYFTLSDHRYQQSWYHPQLHTPRQAVSRDTTLPLARDNLLDSVQHILNDDGCANPFPDNRPGNSWYKLFMRRHPSLAERCAESITRSCGALTEGCIRGWFDDATKFFHDKNIQYVLTDPKNRVSTWPKDRQSSRTNRWSGVLRSWWKQRTNDGTDNHESWRQGKWPVL